MTLQNVTSRNQVQALLSQKRNKYRLPAYPFSQIDQTSPGPLTGPDKPEAEPSEVEIIRQIFIHF
jgi:hypothetical protein